ncbi:hypothetical protein ACP275_12G124700 [Erythranthe tilingii]
MMGLAMLQVLGFVLKTCAFSCAFLIQGSAVHHVSNENVFVSIAPTPLLQPNDTALQPSPSISPPNVYVPPAPSFDDSVPSMPPILPPAPATSPSTSSPPEATPPNSRQTKSPTYNAPVSTVAPVSNVPVWTESPPPSHSVSPQEPPSLPPDASTPPALPAGPPPVKPILNEPPPSSPPEQNASPPILAPPPLRTSKKTPAMPIAAPANKTSYPYAPPVSHSPTKAPTVSAPPPRAFSKSKGSHGKVHKITPAPLSDAVPPNSGSSDKHYSRTPPAPSPSPVSPSHHAKIPFVFPKISPSVSPPRSPKLPLLPPMGSLPPPPPNKACGPLTCTEPLTYGPPGSPCVCVLPIQVGLRLSVALYTFFPLVSELASEIAAGVFMKQSQVRIMGANAAGDNPEKTIALIGLLPLGEKFDSTTAYLTFQRLWLKQVVIKSSFFGEYDVLYVRYPGLPPSPPLPPSTIGIIPSKPYPGHDNNARTIHPLGVDISGKQQKQGISRNIIATIVLSCFVAVILLSALAWVFLFRQRYRVFQPGPNPPIMLPSHTKSSAVAVSMLGSGISSPPFSLGSSITGYTGSAKTFSSIDIERATDFFNETRILGEGGFGLVYRGVLEDGTEVAMKVLKRCDQQGNREFFAEVEMLGRLHHRNLVKLIGICVEDRTRCLVYELIRNGSVDSHLHGFDKERSPLDWSARLKIALGSARALAYLHEDSSPRVIHRDFKASNILLEDDFTPKVSDFGLARTALDEENTHVSTRVMGTFGYVAPEYAMTGHLLVKSDVYSYGVVLLELLTGRKPVDMSQPAGEENLVSWARPLLTSREGLDSIIDQSLVLPDFSPDSVSKVAAIASMCVQPEVSHRPFMGEVVQALKLVCNECEDLRESPSRSFCSREEDLSLATVGTNSDTMPAHLLSPSSVSDYDYRLDVERDRDLSMSELLSSSAKFGAEDCESFRRHSSSGPLRMGKTKPLWKTMRKLSRGSVSEHGVLFRFWPGSH